LTVLVGFCCCIRLCKTWCIYAAAVMGMHPPMIHVGRWVTRAQVSEHG
jgi:hypothetical protein